MEREKQTPKTILKTRKLKEEEKETERGKYKAHMLKKVYGNYIK